MEKHPTTEFLQLLGARTPLCSTLVNLTPHPPPTPPPLTYMPMQQMWPVHAQMDKLQACARNHPQADPSKLHPLLLGIEIDLGQDPWL